jgi:fibro-slime domain-containing protein
MNDSSRRRFLQTIGVGGLIGASGCLRLEADADNGGTPTPEIKDTDGDGVIDSEDYAPRDPSIQNAAQANQSEPTPRETKTAAEPTPTETETAAEPTPTETETAAEPTPTETETPTEPTPTEMPTESVQTGYHGTYYNLPRSHPDIGSPSDIQPRQGLVKENLPLELTSKGQEYINQFDWFSAEYEVFSRVDQSLDWGSSGFVPISGSASSFAAQWTATVTVSEYAYYRIKIGSDDDTWVFLDDKLVLDNGNIHAFNTVQSDLHLREGKYSLKIFYANRYDWSGLNFSIDDRLSVTVPQGLR